MAPRPDISLVTDPSDSIAQLEREISAFVQERDWAQFHDPKNLAMLLTSETGELAAEFRWVDNGAADAHAFGAARDRIEAELADVAIATLMLATRMQIDLASAIRRKLRVNASRYPVDVSRGRSERPST